MGSEQTPHFLLVAFAVPSHINPALQFAKRLLRTGANVTFVTSTSGMGLIKKAHLPKKLEFAIFSDGYENGSKSNDGEAGLVSNVINFQERGSKSLGGVIEKSREEGKPVTCVVYTLTLPWAGQVAREYHVPSAVLWLQAAAVFALYYYYFREYGDVIQECENNPSWSLELPNLPFTLKARDLPSFFLPSTKYPYTLVLSMFQEQLEELEKEESPTIFVNTFDASEVDAIKAIKRFTLIPVGPLIPDKSFGGDLFQKSKDEDYFKWLDSQKESSVIYVSFGSVSVLSGPQQEELARALIQMHKPFLWVIREKEDENTNGNKLSCIEELKQAGMIVPWCYQVEVLSHPSVGCFVTHCGWNSTLESLTSGVPMVTFPQWTDQPTNAKLVESVWKVGVRVEKNVEDGLVKEEEIKRCLEVVLESEEMRKNARKWKELGIQAAKEGGGSDQNLKAFVQQIVSRQNK